MHVPRAAATLGATAFGIVLLGVVTVSPAASAAAPPPSGVGTLTLVAEYSGGDITDQRLVLTASGPGGTLSGPPGTSGQVVPGTYALSVGPGAFGDIFYRLAEIVCSNAPSGVSEVTLGVGDHVVCTFEFLVALPAVVPRSPNIAAPSDRTDDAMPITGLDTAVPAVVGTLLILLGTGLVALSRRPRPASGRTLGR